MYYEVPLQATYHIAACDSSDCKQYVSAKEQALKLVAFLNFSILAFSVQVEVLARRWSSPLKLQNHHLNKFVTDCQALFDFWEVDEFTPLAFASLQVIQKSNFWFLFVRSLVPIHIIVALSLYILQLICNWIIILRNYQSFLNRAWPSFENPEAEAELQLRFFQLFWLANPIFLPKCKERELAHLSFKTCPEQR